MSVASKTIPGASPAVPEHLAIVPLDLPTSFNSLYCDTEDQKAGHQTVFGIDEIAISMDFIKAIVGDNTVASPEFAICEMGAMPVAFFKTFQGEGRCRCHP
jgi:hypothetical protein